VIYASVDKTGLSSISTENDVDGEIVYCLKGIEMRHLQVVEWLLDYNLRIAALVNLLSFASDRIVIKDTGELSYEEFVKQSAPAFIAQFDVNGLKHVYESTYPDRLTGIVVLCYLSIDDYLEFMSLVRNSRFLAAAQFILTYVKKRFLKGSERDLWSICYD